MNIKRIGEIWRRARVLTQLELAVREDRKLRREGKFLQALPAYDDARDYTKVARDAGASTAQIKESIKRGEREM